nr:hypothetical protein [Tanacetum cinerariifolium]
MAAVVQNINNSTLKSVLQSEKLTGPNSTNWHQNLRISLRLEHKLVHLEQPLIPLPLLAASQVTRDAYDALFDAQNEVACLMLGEGDADNTNKKERGQSHILKMKGYLDTLERLGYPMPNELGTIVELHVMLKLYEKGNPKKAETSVLLTIREGRIQKDKKKLQREKGMDKGNNKLAYAPKPKIPPPPKRENLAKDSICHHCKEGIRKSMKLKHRALSLYVGNGMRAVVEAIRSFDLEPNMGWTLNIYGFVGLVINKKQMLQRDRILQPTHDESLEKCKSCISRKMAWKPFPHKVERAKDLLGLKHTDVCGPFRTVSRESASYFITFTDDFSRYGFVYPMKHKHEVFKTFKVFQNEVENQLGKKIKAIRSDRGGEYLSHEFGNHMKSCGIVSQLTPPYTPQHNEVSERSNQTLLDMVRSMMNLTTLPESFCGYALESTACILNMVPTNKALIKRETLDKLDPKSIKCIFIGYPKETMGYYLYNPLENKIFVARNAEFFENSLTLQKARMSHGLLKMSKSDVGLELIQEDDTQPSDNTNKRHNEVESTKVEPHST